MAARRAAFLDRDGTVIEDTHYLANPDEVVLIEGAANAIRMLSAAGFAPVIITNQSGIAQGLYTESDFRAVQQRVEDLLAEQGAAIEAVFHCPHHPDFTGPCECRKPGLLLYTEAVALLGIDVARSIFIGDRVRDVLPALHMGGRGYLVLTGAGQAEQGSVPEGVSTMDDLLAVAVEVCRRG